jgi:hypothetical protein
MSPHLTGALGKVMKGDITGAIGHAMKDPKISGKVTKAIGKLAGGE